MPTSTTLALLSLPAYYALSIAPHMYGATLATNGDITKHDNSNPHGSSASKRTTSALSPALLAKYERSEACHRNCMENMPIFYASLLVGLLAEQKSGRDLGLGTFAVGWMVSRVIYVGNYIVTESKEWSLLRSLMYFVGTGWCFKMCWKAAGELA